MLKAVENKLQGWNKEVFGQIGQRVKQAKDKVLELEANFDRDSTITNKIVLCKAKQELMTDSRLRRYSGGKKLILDG